jgi:hypothetical protein
MSLEIRKMRSTSRLSFSWFSLGARERVHTHTHTHTHTIHTFLTIFLSFLLFFKSLNFRNLRTSLSVVLHTVFRAQHLGMLSGVQMFPTAYETLRCCNYTSANDLEVPNSHAAVLYKVLIIIVLLSFLRGKCRLIRPASCLSVCLSVCLSPYQLQTNWYNFMEFSTEVIPLKVTSAP